MLELLGAAKEFKQQRHKALYMDIDNRKPKTAYYLHFTQCIDYFYAMQLYKIFNTRTVSQDKLY